MAAWLPNEVPADASKLLERPSGVWEGIGERFRLGCRHPRPCRSVAPSTDRSSFISSRRWRGATAGAGIDDRSDDNVRHRLVLVAAVPRPAGGSPAWDRRRRARAPGW